MIVCHILLVIAIIQLSLIGMLVEKICNALEQKESK